MTDPVRVALLARAGQARDQLHKALGESGAQIVAEGDPAELDPKDVAETSPSVFLVSLEPATEKSIERFESLFEASGVEVMFDDAEVTAKLDGWDLNRWARHLASKLTGRESLPPAPEGALAIGGAHDEAHDAGALLQPGLPTTPAEEMAGARLEDYTAESPELAEWIPSNPSLAATPVGEEADASAAADEFAWDGSAEATEAGAKEFKLDDDLGIDIDLGALELATMASPPEPDAEAEVALDESQFPDLPEGVRFSTFDDDANIDASGDIDADVAALAAQLEAFEQADTRGVAVEPEFAKAPAMADASAPAPAPGKPAAGRPVETAKAAAKAPATIDFSNLSLAPEGGELENAPPIEAKFSPVVEPVANAGTPRFGEMSLETHAIADKRAELGVATVVRHGAVLVLAGLGGPDAVRQLLSSLPERLGAPVLLYQHLEVGKHERLVEQLAKISKLPVVLAKEGDMPEVSQVTLLPAGMTAEVVDEGLRFVQGALSKLIGSLPPADSMVIVLSGADAQLVPMILEVKEGGGIVLAQDPEVCFDGAAAEAMRKEGAQVFPALGLARQIQQRYS